MALSVYDMPVDSNLVLKTAGLVAADAAGASLTGGVASVDIGGAANSYQRFAVVIDWTACEVASSDEIYDVRVQGSDNSSFSGTPHVLGRFVFGATGGGTVQPVNTPPAGRKVIFMDNHGFTSATDGNSFTTCRYIRLQVDVGGTIATGMNLTAYVVPIS